MKREIKFEYGFQSVNGIIKKQYFLHEIPNIKEKCDIFNVLPIVYVRQFTGLEDKNGVDAYDGDKIIFTELIAQEEDHGGVFGTEFLGWKVVKVEKIIEFENGMFTTGNQEPLFHCQIDSRFYEIEDYNDVENEDINSDEDLDKILGFEITGNIHEK